jgi:hypothetical protein
MTTTMPQVSPQVLNMQQRAAVLSNAVTMTQPLFNGNFDPSQQSVINIPPRNVGIIRGFIIEVTATLTNGAGTVANRTGFGSANLVKNVTFNDLNNNVRVNVPGWYLAMLDSARQGWAYGGAYANNLAMGYGNNWNVNAGPATIAAATDAQVRHIYYLPMAYSPTDLRGAIYAGVVSAQMNLQVTLNTAPFAGAGDPLSAVYSGNAAGGYKAGTPVNVSVYQVYLDQIPVLNGSPVLPILDMNTIYELKTSVLSGVTQNQDFPLPYSNFRDFLSTMAVFDNGGVFNSGSDVNYWSLISANTTNLFRMAPEIAALMARQTFMSDPPPGLYYFDHRDRPINTLAFGNMALNLNASNVNAGAQVVVGYEAFAQVNSLNSSAASSLSQ